MPKFATYWTNEDYEQLTRLVLRVARKANCPIISSHGGYTLPVVLAAAVCHTSKGTPRFATEIAASAEWAMAHASEFKPPLLLLHGDADRIVDVQASRDFFARVPHDDKKLIIYEGGYHEPPNDIEYERVVQDIKAWLEEHM